MSIGYGFFGGISDAMSSLIEDHVVPMTSSFCVHSSSADKAYCMASLHITRECPDLPFRFNPAAGGSIGKHATAPLRGHGPWKRTPRSVAKEDGTEITGGA